MLMMTLERVPARLRGELTRWLLEIQTGVYVGKVSPTVRDLLWEKAIAGTGKISQVWRANCEQGFDFRICGDKRRQVVEFDGLKLIALQTAEADRKKRPPKASGKRDT